MTRVHIAITVSGLERSIGFCTTGAITRYGEDLEPGSGAGTGTAAAA